MNRYETLFILHPDLPEAQRKETIERVRRLADGMGVQDFAVEEWGLRDLAYLINKQSRGIYVRIEYTSRPEVVKEIERTMKLADEILRFVSVRLPVTRKEAPAAAPKPSRPAPAPEAETPAAE
jgi:small subunit ribosomal protein S6